MSRTVITGSTGLIGSAVHRLIANEEGVVSLRQSDLDLTQREPTLKFFKDFSPDRIFHCAAKVGGMSANSRFPATMHRENLMMNLNVLDASQNSQKTKILGFLSSCIFPNETSYPLRSSGLHLGPPHESNFGYAYAKRMLEVEARAYRKEFGASIVLLTPTNVFGPYDNFHLSDGHVLPSLIHRMHLAKEKNEDFVVWGTGKPLREFVFSEDVARLCVWAMDHYEGEEALFLTHGEEFSIRSAVELLAKLMNFKGRIIFDETKPDGQYRKPSDPEPLKRLYPDFKFTPFEEALGQTVTWFKERYPNVRK